MKIFISYRRDDSAGYAGRLFDHLSKHFGQRNIFMDVDTIQPGEDFRKAIEKAVGSCDVVIVMIGRQWLSATNQEGKRRLDDPTDFVRAEIASALANPNVRVIPVLVRDTGMPRGNDLPDDLKDLVWRNATELSDNRFPYDANRLIEVIESLETGNVKSKITKISPGKIAGAFLAVTGLALIVWLARSGLIPMGVSQTPTPSQIMATASPLPVTSTPTQASASPTATENPIAPSVRTVDQYFQYINNAGIDEDLRQAWNLLTNKLQCNPSDQCNFETYRKFWWTVQVQYKLYDCGSNTVTAKLLYYTRNKTANPNNSPTYLKYQLVDENGQLKLDSASTVAGVSSSCTLAVSVPVTPAPVILGIETRKTGDAPNQIIFADINFRDEDGDSYVVKYSLVSATVSSGLKYADDQIPTSPNRQMAGTILPVQWNCDGRGYTATFDVIILDRAGNQSNRFPVTFDCR